MHISASALPHSTQNFLPAGFQFYNSRSAF